MFLGIAPLGIGPLGIDPNDTIIRGNVLFRRPEPNDLPASTHKKVIVRRYDRSAIQGFVNPVSFATTAGVEMLTAGGMTVLLPYGEVKYVAFVRDWETGERGERKQFTSRPKLDGLWVRAEFLDSETLEGIIPNNLLAIEPFGYSITPPDASANRQKLFVPRESLRSFEVLGVVGSPLRRPRAKEPVAGQIGLFD